MNINFKEVILNNYGGFKLKANIDENPEDIIAAVLYDDHGDDFLVVKTNDAVYEYGLFVTRNGFDARALNDESHHERKRLESFFDKLPKLTGPLDYRSEKENTIYRLIKNKMCNTGWFQLDTIRKCDTKRDAQMCFIIVYSGIKEIYETNFIYHCESHHYLDRIVEFMKENEIETEDNLQKIEDLKMFLRINCIDGDAGKVKRDSDHVIYGDDIKWIWYRNELITKKFNKHKIKVKSTYDNEWGVDGFRLNMKQFFA